MEKKRRISRAKRISAHEILINIYQTGKTPQDKYHKCSLCCLTTESAENTYKTVECKKCTILPFEKYRERLYYWNIEDAPCITQYTYKLTCKGNVETELSQAFFEPRIAFHRQIIRWLKNGCELREIQMKITKLDEELYQKYLEKNCDRD